MQKKYWFHTALGLVLMRMLMPNATPLHAAPPAGGAKAPAAASVRAAPNRYETGRGAGSFQSRLERAVGLTSEQRDVVRGLLAQQHEELRTIRESFEPKVASIHAQTDAKIRALLNPEQQKKLDAFLTQQKKARAARSRRAS